MFMECDLRAISIPGIRAVWSSALQGEKKMNKLKAIGWPRRIAELNSMMV